MDVWLQIRNVETAEGTVTEPESLETAAYDIDGVCRYGLIAGGQQRPQLEQLHDQHGLSPAFGINHGSEK